LLAHFHRAKGGLDFFKPVKPNTIAKSLAIGTPADGFYALKVMKETNGRADDVTDDQIREGIKLLAECEGILPKRPAASPWAWPRN
jgi:threonine synthase